MMHNSNQYPPPAFDSQFFHLGDGEEPGPFTSSSVAIPLPPPPPPPFAPAAFPPPMQPHTQQQPGDTLFSSHAQCTQLPPPPPPPRPTWEGRFMRRTPPSAAAPIKWLAHRQPHTLALVQLSLPTTETQSQPQQQTQQPPQHARMDVTFEAAPEERPGHRVLQSSFPLFFADLARLRFTASGGPRDATPGPCLLFWGGDRRRDKDKAAAGAGGGGAPAPAPAVGSISAFVFETEAELHACLQLLRVALPGTVVDCVLPNTYIP